MPGCPAVRYSAPRHVRDTARDSPAGGGVGLVVRRLGVRREEIVDGIFARLRSVLPVAIRAGERDTEYAVGLRGAVAAAVDFALRSLDSEGGSVVAVPGEVVSQARLAARSSVGLDVVFRRYMVGHALLWDYVMEEAAQVGLAGGESGLRGMLRGQAALLDELLAAVAHEYAVELERAGRSREQRLMELVVMALAGGYVDGIELGYELDGAHLGVIARGNGSEELLRAVAEGLERRLLCVARGQGTIWAWLGGQHTISMEDLKGFLSQEASRAGHACGPAGEGWLFAVGEPGLGIEGWRLTHQQAQAALLVALRRPERFTRYRNVALLAAALQDETLAGSLLEMYIAPLRDARSGQSVLCETLRAYVAAECNSSSTAAALGVARSTVENRLRGIEARLGHSLHPCPAELEVALHLDDLNTQTPQRIRAVDSSV